MSSRYTKKYWQSIFWRSLLVIGISLIALFFIFENKDQIPTTKVTTIKTIIETKKESIGLPMRLKIPVINVDATIIYVGLTPDGAMETADGANEVAWYKFGPRPGENGSAVIAGHYGWLNETPSIFNDLNTLNIGDEVIVIDDKGKNITFIVRESIKYNPDADTTNIFKSNDGKAHLNLITCNGTWENSQQTYSDRLVIFTDEK